MKNNIEFNEINIIPQNKNTLFSIYESKDYNHALEIKIAYNEEIDIINLFIIVKSYVCSLIYIPKDFLIKIKNPNEQSFIIYSKDISKFKNINYSSFYEWYYEEYHKNELYIKTNGIYSFVITYPINIFNREVISLIKPKYPWELSIIEELNIDIENDLLNKFKIKELSLELSKIKKLYEDLLNKK